MSLEERNKLLTEIYNLNLVQNYCKKICYDDENQIDDIIGEIFLQITEIPCEKWDVLLEQGTSTDPLKAIRAFISGICYRNIRSTNSKVWYKLKRHESIEYTKTDEEWEILNSYFQDNTLNNKVNGKSE